MTQCPCKKFYNDTYLALVNINVSFSHHKTVKLTTYILYVSMYEILHFFKFCRIGTS